MSAHPVADMLAELIGPLASANRSPTPAKAANSANREHPCGSAADSGAANGLRILRIEGPQPARANADSQTFAAIRKPANSPQSEQRRGFSQDSQDSQGCPRTCDPPIVARLQRWGWPHAEAQAQAERLRDRDDHADYRHLCLECRHYRPGRCGNHKAADLLSPAVGKDLATMFQDCPGFVAVEGVR